MRRDFPMPPIHDETLNGDALIHAITHESLSTISSLLSSLDRSSRTSAMLIVSPVFERRYNTNTNGTNTNTNRTNTNTKGTNSTTHPSHGFLHHRPLSTMHGSQRMPISEGHEGWSPFLVACACGDVTVVEMLASTFLDLSSRTLFAANSFTSMHTSNIPSHSNSPLPLLHALQMLHAPHPNVRLRLTPLHIAALRGDVALCRFLVLTLRADRSVRDAQRRTPAQCVPHHLESLRKFLSPHDAFRSQTQKDLNAQTLPSSSSIQNTAIEVENHTNLPQVESNHGGVGESVKAQKQKHEDDQGVEGQRHDRDEAQSRGYQHQGQTMGQSIRGMDLDYTASGYQSMYPEETVSSHPSEAEINRVEVSSSGFSSYRSMRSDRTSHMTQLLRSVHENLPLLEISTDDNSKPKPQQNLPHNHRSIYGPSASASDFPQNQQDFHRPSPTHVKSHKLGSPQAKDGKLSRESRPDLYSYASPHRSDSFVVDMTSSSNSGSDSESADSSSSSESYSGNSASQQKLTMLHHQDYEQSGQPHTLLVSPRIDPEQHYSSIPLSIPQSDVQDRQNINTENHTAPFEKASELESHDSPSSPQSSTLHRVQNFYLSRISQDITPSSPTYPTIPERHRRAPNPSLQARIDRFTTLKLRSSQEF